MNKAVASLKFHRRTMGAFLALTAAGCLSQGIASAQVASANGVTSITVTNSEQIDFVNAQPLALPNNTQAPDSAVAMAQALLAPSAPSAPIFSTGGVGTGETNPVFLGTPAGTAEGVSPEDYGTNNHPFTTVRADLYSENTNTTYPYRAAGKLFFKIGTANYICSASMIKPGIVVTAAHCVSNYGKSQFYGSWQFVPGYRNGSAPYGVWTARTAYVLTSYYKGTDGCAVYGIVCPDDVALLVLNTQSGKYVGSTVGWFGYGYGGYGYVSNITQVTQLGYPAGLDNAAYMERTDSYGYVSSGNSNNTIIGSNMNGGSSGGPWLINFGLPSALTGETNGGAFGGNAIVGVTSWGYTSTSPKEMGAAPFTSGNIQNLITVACKAFAGAC